MRKLIWIFLLPLQVFATNFYVSNSGSDTAAGTIGAPWATIAKVNASMASFMPGDSVLFQRGGTFVGTLNINRNSVVFGAYGNGNRPILTGFYTIPSWTSAGTNLWTATIPAGLNNVRLVTLNDRIIRCGRYPNYADDFTAWIRYTNSLTDTASVKVNAGSSLPANYTGGEAVLFKSNWELDVMPITNQSGNTLTCDNPPGLYGRAVTDYLGLGFFVQNSINTLNLQNEWAYNNANKVLTYYSTTNPASLGTIKIARLTTLISLNNTSGVTIENLEVQGCSEKGITATGGSNHTIKNCTIRFIQGWGIDIRSSNALIENNFMRDIGGNGIWITNSAIIRNNSLRAIACIEGLSGLTNTGAGTQSNQNNQHAGIDIETGGTPTVLCSQNTLDSIGGNGIRYYGSNITIEKNVINYPAIMKSDAGGIYSWDNFAGVTWTNRRVKNNIILNSGKFLYGTATPTLNTNSYGIYFDGGSNNILCDSNVVGPSLYSAQSACNPGTGVTRTTDDAAYMMNFAWNITMRRNIAIGWPDCLEFWRYTGRREMSGLRIVDNAFYTQNSTGDACTWNSAIEFFSLDNSTYDQIKTYIQNIGVIDSNYVNNNAPSPYFYRSYPNISPATKISDWRTYSGKSARDTTFPAGTPEFQYNTTATPITYTFTGRQKRDFRGNTYNNSATIPAYYGNIFFDNGPAGANPPTASCSATTISCNGGSATVTVTGSGGTPPLSGTGTFTRTAGTYTFTVTDANGLTGTCSVTITQPTALVASNTAGTITTVGGSANIVVTASGGTAPYFGTGTFSRTAGTYTFTVTDANGCTATTTRTLTNPSPVVVTCSATPILCNAGTSTVTVSASGGTGPYLNTGSFIRSAGSYTFSVTDAVGATGSCSVTITEPAVLVAAATAGTISSVGGTTSVVVTATGGVGPYTGTGTFTRGAGIHTFTVTDANGCTSFVIVSLNDPVIVAPQTLRINNIRFTNGN